MSREEIKQIEQVFQRAADLPAEARPAFLEQECAGRPGVRRRVEAMLERLERDETLDGPATAWAAHAQVTEGPGSEIGRYKLLQRIGEGGFGVVYVAEQQEPVRRKVALKIIKLGMDTREVVARFEAERQALAMMEHPSIARVLDGGATDTGRPYFVMELVRGVSITEYCDSNSLSMRERLGLFIQTCNAVQHAHQKGVIHRDLKPSNVLVTLQDGAPVPKVIDFGVAKAMHTRLTEKTLFTAYDRFIGTPAYMSPEQAQMSALDIDTRSDIYSLGVLLYELLTGTTPFEPSELMRGGLVEIQRILGEEQPPRPSLRISRDSDASAAERRGLDVEGLFRRLRGDLDWIVMKSLEKDRSRRYESASELAADIRRHLDREPVQAAQPSRAYRLRRFLARHRAAVFSASLVAIALVAGIVGTSFAMLEASRQRDVAVNARAAVEEEAEQTRAVTDFLIDTLALTDPDVALDVNLSVATLLNKAATQVAEVFANNPEAEARVRGTIGRAYRALGKNELAELNLRRATDLARTIPGFDRAALYQAMWDLTHVLFSLERPDAMAVAQEARRVAHDHIRVHHAALADSLDRFIDTVNDAAFSMDAEAGAVLPQLFDDTVRESDAAIPAGDPLWPIVADTWIAAGYSLWYGPLEPLTESFFRRAFEIQRRELPANHSRPGETMGLLVGVLNRIGKAAEAESAIRESVERMREVLRPGNPQLAFAESMLGANLVSQGRYAEAEPLLLSGHAVIVETIGDGGNFAVADSYGRVLEMYGGWGREERAVPYRQRLAGICADWEMLQPWYIARLAFGPQQRELLALLERMEELSGGVSYTARPGRAYAPEMEGVLDRLLRLRRSTLPDEHPLAAVVARELLGWSKALEPERAAATRRRMIEEALRLLASRESKLAVEIAEGRAELSRMMLAQGDTRESAAQVRRAWDLARGHRDDTWITANMKVRIARALVEQALYPEAESLLVPSYEMLTQHFGGPNADAEAARRLLVRLYEAWGKPQQAAGYASEDDAPAQAS